MTPNKLTRPIDYAKQSLIERILDNTYAIGERLPAERELAEELGITRPTLREALRHLEQEGWVLVQHGKPTLVRDFWREGGMNVFSRIIMHDGYIKPSFITDLLEFRLLLAPTYARAAIENNADKIAVFLATMPPLEALPESYAAFDWRLQQELTVASGNVIFPLILNGFAQFYERIALIYFQPSEARAASHRYYADLAVAAVAQDAVAALTITQQVMADSIRYWQAVSKDLHKIAL